MGKCLTLTSFVVAAVAILIGLLFSSIPANLGLYRWLARMRPAYIGMAPAFVDGEWGYTFQELYSNDLSGQTAIVTGANSGIGYETALALARLGASVTMACRSPERCEAAAERIRADQDTRGNVTTRILDTSSMKSVKDFALPYLEANQDKALDMLFLNAGMGPTGLKEQGFIPVTEEGIETIFATNHVGHCLLYKLLEPLLFKSEMARVVLTSSAGSFRTPEFVVATDLATLKSIPPDMKSYGMTKLAQILFAKELTRRLGDNSSIYVNTYHPGAVDTEIWEKYLPKHLDQVVKHIQRNAMWTSAEGALTGLYLGVSGQVKTKDIRGTYFHPQAKEVVNPLSLDEDLQKRVWDFTYELVKEFL